MKNNICVYCHRRLDNNKIFYIGIGYKHRSEDKNNRNKYWNNIVNKSEYSVEILRENLSWEEACELEIFLISLYGRKDLNTGCLCNLTDGGEGSYGRKISEETRKKLGKGKENNKWWVGRKHKKESKEKIRKFRQGRENPLVQKK